MKAIHLFIFSIFLCSCRKEPLIDVSPEFVGTWIHFESSEKFKYLSISENGKGYIYYSLGWSVYGDTQTRRWVTKNNYLYFGWLGTGDEKFKIDRYPDTSDTDFIVGSDTIPAGERYAILNGDHYVSM